MARRFGEQAIARATPLRSWCDEGVLVAGGSDSPITPFEPLRGIWQAVTRHSADTGEALGPGECLSAERALALYTTNAARACFSEADGGALRVGARGDWVALGGDPLTCPADELRDLPILCTAVDGDLLHDAR